MLGKGSLMELKLVYVFEVYLRGLVLLTLARRVSHTHTHREKMESL